jgi:hypothetical protein
MKKIIIICVIVIASIVVTTGLIIGGIFGFRYLKEREENRYKESDAVKLIQFFNENRDLLEDARDACLTFQRKAADKENDCLTFEFIELEDSLSEYYKKVNLAKLPNCVTPDYNPYYPEGVEFSFYYSTNRIKAGFIYTEEKPDDSRYVKLDDNWYLFEYAMV